jgi:hypothetical protein
MCGKHIALEALAAQRAGESGYEMQSPAEGGFRARLVAKST